MQKKDDAFRSCSTPNIVKSKMLARGELPMYILFGNDIEIHTNSQGSSVSRRII